MFCSELDRFEVEILVKVFYNEKCKLIPFSKKCLCSFRDSAAIVEDCSSCISAEVNLKREKNNLKIHVKGKTPGEKFEKVDKAEFQ